MNYRVPDHVHFRNLHGEVVLLDTKTDAYLGLNQTAAVAWEVLAGGGSQEAAADSLIARFDVAPEVAQADVAALVGDLLARGLIEAVG